MNKFQNLNLGVDLLNAKVNAGVKALPPFYRNILDMWFSFKGTRSSSPQTRDVLAEPIFFNRQILDTDTGLPLKAPPIYVEHSLVRVTDISYSVVPALLPNAAVHELLGANKKCERNTKMYMGHLCSALPTEWRGLINTDADSEVSADRNSFHIFDPKTNEKIPIIKLMTKKIYDI